MWRCGGKKVDETETRYGEEELPAPQPIGFLKRQFQVPEDFDLMGQDEILEMFGLA